MLRFLRSLTFLWLLLLQFVSITARSQDLLTFNSPFTGTIEDIVHGYSIFTGSSLQATSNNGVAFDFASAFSYRDQPNGKGILTQQHNGGFSFSRALGFWYTETAGDKVIFSRADGKNFTFTSVMIGVVAPINPKMVMFRGYRNGVLVASEAVSVGVGGSTSQTYFASAAAWKVVTQVEVESLSGTFGLMFDQLTVDVAPEPQLSFNSAVVNPQLQIYQFTGTIISNTGPGITEAGFYWTDQPLPQPITQNTFKAIEGTNITGGFVSSSILMAKGASYRLVSYVKNSIGTFYSAERIINIPLDPPVITRVTSSPTKEEYVTYNMAFLRPVSLPQLPAMLNLVTTGNISGNFTTAHSIGNGWNVTVQTTGDEGSIQLEFTGNNTSVPYTSTTKAGSPAITIDRVKPVVSITSPSPAVSIGPDFSISYSLSETASVTYSVDGGPAVPATSPFTYTAPGPGSYVMTISALDGVGNASVPQTLNLAVVQTPTAAFVSTPPATTNNTNAAFTVNSDIPGSTFSYELDGVLQSATGNTLSLSGLMPGTHTLLVFAESGGNKQATGTAFTWEIDQTVPGKPVITGLINDNGFSNSDRITSSTSVGVSGESEPGAIVNIQYDGTFVGQSIADGSGAWSFLYPFTVTAGNHIFKATQTDKAGNVSTFSDDFSFTADLTRPKVTSIAQPPAGNLRPGLSIEFIATLSEPIDGYPNSCSMFYTYGGQSYEFEFGGFQDGNKIIFRYVLKPGESFTNMFQSGWTFNGIVADHGDMTDISGNHADFTTVPAPVVTNIINSDPVAPVVTGDPVITDGNYILNSEILITRTFSENVFVTGNPSIILIIGSEVGRANYFSGNGTSTLTFKYAVPADVEGVVEAYKSLSMAGATIKDAAGNNATGLSAGGSVINSNAIVDSKAPRYSGTAVITPYVTGGQEVQLDISFNENVFVTSPPVPYIQGMVGGVARQFDYAFANGKKLRFKWTVPADVEDHDGIELSDAIQGAGLIITDGLGNPAVLDLGDSIRITSGLIIDSKAPVITEIVQPDAGFYRSGAVLVYTVKFSEIVLVGSAYPKLHVNIGGTPHILNYWNGDGTKELKFKLGVQPGMNEPVGVLISAFAPGTLTDFYGNAFNGTVIPIPAISGIVIDNTAPLATSFTSTSGNYKLGDVISFEIGYNEEMVAFGSNLALEVGIGSRTEYLPLTLSADKLSLRASYTVAAGDEDLDGIFIIRQIRSRDGTSHLKDRAGNVFSLAFPGTLYNINVDGNAPQVLGHQILGDYYKPGDVLKVNVTFNKQVSVTSGVPELDIVTGATVLTLHYTGQPGSSVLTYELTIPAGVPCGRIDGIQFSTLTRSGVISDNFGNVLTSAANFTMVDNHYFDNCAPVITNTLNFSVNEKSAAGTFVGQPVATESPDASRTLTWEISGQIDLGGHGIFPLAINTATGEITVKDPDGFRFAVQPVVTALVRVYDGANWSNSHTVTVTVLDVNEAPSNITISNTTINEVEHIGATVGALSSTDDDAGETFTYSLVAGTGSADNNSFAIAGNSLITNTILNRYTKASYAIRVRTTDSDGLYFEKAFTINVTDTSRPRINWESLVDGSSKNAAFDVVLVSTEPLLGLSVSDFNILNTTVSNLVNLGSNRYQITLTPTLDGVYTISLPDNVAQDNAGNQNIGSGNRTFYYDTQRPTVIMSGLTASPANVPIQFDLIFSEKVSGLSEVGMLVFNGNTVITTTDQQHYSVTITPIANGAVTWGLYNDIARDAAGNGSVGLGNYTVVYDNTRPTATLSAIPAGPNVNGNVNITVDVSELNLTLLASHFVPVNATISGFSQVSSTIYQFTLVPGSEGACSVQLAENSFKDAAGNWNTASNKIDLNFDVTPPTATMTTSAPANTNVSPIPVTLTFSEKMSGLNPAVFNTAASGTIHNLTTTDNITWTFDLLPSAPGDAVVVLPAGYVTDLAGNLNTGINEVRVKYDPTAPSPIFYTSSSGGINQPVYVRVMFMEEVTGFTETDLALTNCTVSDWVVEDSRNYTFTINGTPDTQGDMSVALPQNILTDLAGNGNIAGNITVAYDRKGPVVSMTNLAAGVVTGPFQVRVSVGETPYGFAAANMLIINGSVTSFAPDGVNSFLITVTPDQDGDVYVALPVNAILDATGNGNTPIDFTVPYDLNPPTPTIHTHYSSPFNGDFDGSVIFSERVSGFVQNELLITNGTISNWATTDNIAYTFTVTPLSEGTVTLNVNADVAVDRVNRNNLAAAPLSVQIDKTPPTVQLVSSTPNPTNSSISLTATFSEAVYGFTDADVVISNGTIGNFHTNDGIVYTFNVVPAGEGNITVTLHPGAGRDRAGNANTLAMLTIVYDITPPDAVITSSATSPTSAAIPFTVTFTEKVLNFVQTDLQVTNGNITGFTTTDNITWDVTVAPVADGPVTVGMLSGIANDEAGNLNNAATDIIVTYDGSVPGVTLSTTSPAIANTAITLTATFTEAVTSFPLTDFVVVNGQVNTLVQVSPNKWTFTLTPVGNDIDVSVYLPAGKAFDGAGNGNALSNTLTYHYDATAPAVLTSTTAGSNVKAPFEITVQFSEPVSGFTASDIVLDNGTVTSFTISGTNKWTITVTPVRDDAVNVQFPANMATDAAGNGNTAGGTMTFHYDATAPGVTLSTSAASPVNGAFTVTATFTEPVSDVILSDVNVSNGTKSGFTVLDASTYTFIITPTAGAVSISLPAGAGTDLSGNGNTASNTLALQYDGNQPTVVITTTAASPTNGGIPVTVTFSEAVTGFAAGDITVTNGNVTGLTTSDLITWNFMVIPATSGQVTVNIAANVAADGAGNGNAAAAQLAVVYDIIQPDVTITTTAPAFTNAPVPVTVTFTETVNGFDQGDLIITNGNISGFTTSDNRVWNFTITPAADGFVTINVAAGMAADLAGNANNGAAELSVEYDASRPSVTLVSNVASPVNSLMPITVTFSETVSGFDGSDLIITNGTISRFVDIDQQSFIIRITPTAEGAVTISLPANIATDAMGNSNTAGNMLTLVYDISAPAATFTTTAVSPVGTPFPVTLTFTEPVAGLDISEIQVGNGIVSALTTTDQQTWTFTVTPAADGRVTVNLPAGAVQDAAGNAGAAAVELALDYDASKPGAVISTIATSPVNAAFTATVTFTEAVTGFTAGDVSTTNGTISNLATSDNITYTFTVTPVTSGNVTINVAADVATDISGNGNTAAAELAVVYDGLSPVVVITTTATSPVNAAFPVTVTFSEAVAGFDVSDISITNGIVSNFVSNNSIFYSFTVTPVASGNVTINVAAGVANDAAGNGNAAAGQLSLVYDNSLVGTTITSAVTSPVNGAFPVTVTFTEAVTGFMAGEVTVTNGTISNFATSDNITYTFTVTPVASGNVTINVPANVVTGGAGNGNAAAAELAIMYDGMKPGTVIATAATSPVNAAFPVTVTFTEAVTGFTAGDVSVTNGTISNFATSDNITYSFTVTPIANGNVTINVAANVANDAAGNGNTAATELALAYDGLNPVVVLSTTATSPVNAAFPVTVTFSEAVTGFDVSDITITNGTVSSFATSNNIIYTFSVTPVASGNVTIIVSAGVANDAAGNSNAAANQLSLNYDASLVGTAIATTVTSPVNAAFPVTVTFTKAVTGFIAGDVSVTNGTISNFATSDNITYTFTVTPVTSGNVTINVSANVATDAAGNGNTAAGELALVYDGVKPGAVITTTATSPVNTTFPVTVTFTEAVTGFTAGDVSVTNGTISNFATSDNITYTFTVTPVASGNVTINVAANVATDVAGNGNTAAGELALVYDGVKPGAVITTTTTSPVNATFPVTVTFTKAVTGFIAGDVSVTNGTISNFATSDNITYTFTVTPVTSGNVTINVAANVATDVAGNGNAAATELALVYDGVKPGAVITTTTTSPVNAAFPVTVTFTETVTDFTAGDVSVTNGTISNFATSDNITYTFTVTPVTSGNVTINVAANVATDVAGNGNTAAGELALVYDGVKPGAVIATTTTSPVNATFPVTVTFTEAVTGFVAGDVSVTNGTASNFATSDNITYTFTVTPVASGIVSINVAANVATDVAGNGNTAAGELAIVFDNIRPGVAITTTASSPTNGPVPVTVTFTEAVTGFDASDLNITNGTISSFTAVDAATYTFTVTAAADGVVRINLPAGVANDAAGNSNTPAVELNYSYTGTKPDVTLTATGTNAVNAPIALTIRFSTAVAGFDASDIQLDNATISAPVSADGITWQATVTPVAEGAFSVSIPANAAQGTGGNGNTASNVLNRVYDVTRPAAALQITPASGSNYTVTATFTEAVTGLAAGDINITNGVVSNLQSTGANTYTFTITALAEGNVTVKIPANAATDAAGNGNTASADATVFHSAGAPSVTITSASAAVLNHAFNVTFTFSKPVTGFTAGDVEVTNGAVLNLTAVTDRTFTASIVPAGDGEVTLVVRAGAAVDQGGKANTASNTLSRQYDGTRPGVAVTTTAVSPVNGAFTVQIRFTEKVNGLTNGGLQLQNATAGVITTTDNITYTTVIRPTGGFIQISVKESAVTDDAGNTNTASGVLTMTLDNDMPVAVLTGRNNPYAFGPFTVTVKLNEPSPDFNRTVFQLENAEITAFQQISATQYAITVAPKFAGPAMRIFIPVNRYSDVAGNRNLASNILSYETLQSYTIDNVYPNPTNGRLVVKFGGVIYEKMKMQLISMNGDVVLTKEVEPNSSEVTIDIPASVPDGMYHLMIINGPVKRRNIMLIR
ncbi:Ig-like domain-containing protein [Chitinophaga deserti]|uniref:Ig-like domain-containing protein n=1 Tax=Chitinophaga deserti TaxID=2164099 RepID=UPI000D6DC044|nr:Ig-like domain-containing protein [Chitinophaga deserti]